MESVKMGVLGGFFIAFFLAAMSFLPANTRNNILPLLVKMLPLQFKLGVHVSYKKALFFCFVDFSTVTAGNV